MNFQNVNSFFSSVNKNIKRANIDNNLIFGNFRYKEKNYLCLLCSNNANQKDN